MILSLSLKKSFINFIVEKTENASFSKIFFKGFHSSLILKYDNQFKTFSGYENKTLNTPSVKNSGATADSVNLISVYPLLVLSAYAKK